MRRNPQEQTPVGEVLLAVSRRAAMELVADPAAVPVAAGPRTRSVCRLHYAALAGAGWIAFRCGDESCWLTGSFLSD